MSRISWDSYALKIAEIGALRSEDPYKKVGACALDFSHRVIGVAYNGLAPGMKVKKDFWADRDRRRKFMLHAEANLLSLFKRGECMLLACTLLPCRTCASLIISHNIKRVVYKELYQRDDSAIELFKFYGIECVQVEV
jgi:dCMP deaminase